MFFFQQGVLMSKEGLNMPNADNRTTHKVKHMICIFDKMNWAKAQSKILLVKQYLFIFLKDKYIY